MPLRFFSGSVVAQYTLTRAQNTRRFLIRQIDCSRIRPDVLKILQITGIFWTAYILSPFPTNIIFLTIFMITLGAPMTARFIMPAIPIVFYLLLVRYLHSRHILITLVPKYPALISFNALQYDIFPILLHIVTASLLWHLHSNKSVCSYATRIGNANTISVLALIALPTVWNRSDPPLKAVTDSLNVALAASTLLQYFPRTPLWTICGITMCVVFLVAKHHQDLGGVFSGGCLAATCHVLAFRAQFRGTRGESTDKNPISEPLAPRPLLPVTESLPAPIPKHILDNTLLNPHNFNDAAFDQLELVGKSSTRTLHKVRHTPTGAVYACKTITPRGMDVVQIIRELRPLRVLTHPNIVECYGIYGGEDGEGEVKVVLEYHAMGSLGSVASRIKQSGREFEEGVVGTITEGILQGLVFLHNLQILHRDIKPSNILLSKEGIVKLSEFVPLGESVNKIGDTFLSFIPYTAPERVLGQPYTDRADIWSMGVSLLECIQIRHPYPEDLESVDLMVHIAANDVPPKLDDSGAWSSEMRDFFAKILVKNPDSRPGARVLISHPWITRVMQEDVKMDAWLLRDLRLRN